MIITLIAAEELRIDCAHFQPGCSYTPETFDRGIYWSLRKARKKDNVIVLNDCGGAKYPFSRKRDGQIEFFA